MAEYKNKLVREAEAKKQARKVAEEKIRQEAEKRREEKRKARMNEKTSMQKKFTSLKQIADDKTLSNEAKKERFISAENEAQDRLQEVKTRREKISKEIEGRGKDIDPKILAKLQKEDASLAKEMNVLENFSNIRNQVFRIMDQVKHFETKKAVEYGKAKQELTEIKAKIDRAAEVDKELADLNKYSEEFSQKQELTEEDKKENLENARKYNQLIKEKGSIDNEKLKADLEIANNKVKDYENGRSKEDKLINKCNLAWKMLADGKNWDDIIIASVEDVKERKASKVAEAEVVNQVESKQVEETRQEEVIEGEEQKIDLEEVQKHISKEVEEMLPKKDIMLDRFSNRFPRLSKIPLLGKLIGNIYDKHQEEKERIAELKASLSNDAQKPDRKIDVTVVSKNQEKTAEEKQELSVQDKQELQQETQAENKQELEQEETISQKRDKFMEYLRDMAQNGHTEGKYKQNGRLDKEAQAMKDNLKALEEKRKEEKKRQEGTDELEH